MPLKKPSEESVGSFGTPSLEFLGSWGKKYGTLCEFLSALTWEDGSSRECGKLTLFWDRMDGKWKVSLNCHSTSRSAFVSGETPESVLESTEKLLRADKLDWRPWKAFGGKKKA